MSDFGAYMVAQAERKAAQERYNYASAALELAQIRERFAELKSQADPANAIAATNWDDRDRLIEAARYVVTGRLHPEVAP